jgi:uncharacterized membrane protein
MNAIIARIQNEPVLVTTLVGAVLGLLIVFGVPINDEQKTAVVLLATALLAIFARSQVTPYVPPLPMMVPDPKTPTPKGSES